MEANEAPYKLYIDSREHWRKSWTAFTTKAKGDDIEYTRTDAFIEKAEEWLKLFLNNSVCIKDVGERAKRVIVDDFRKAMKG